MFLRIGPTWKMIIAYIAVIIFALLILVGCGVRKTGIEKTTNFEKGKSGENTNQTENSKSEERETTKEENSQESKKDIVTTEVSKEYNESGNLIKENTKTTVDKSTQKNTSNLNSDKKKVIEKWLKIRTTTYDLLIIKTTTKSKNVAADKTISKNLGGWGVPLTLGIVAIVAIFSYFYFRKKVIS